MDRSRRLVLSTCLSGMAAFVLGAKTVSAQNPLPTVPPPANRRREPASADDPEGPPGPSPGTATKTLLEQRQKDIKKDVEKLFDLASALKTEVEKTDATAVLSMAMVKKAEEIEKLAKQIRDHAKG
jgi:hypothetical protein